LADVLMERKDLIVTYHDHDSLLENREEDALDEDEKKRAWDEYQTQPDGPRPGMIGMAPQMLNDGRPYSLTLDDCLIMVRNRLAGLPSKNPIVLVVQFLGMRSSRFCEVIKR
jgi:hypothetical protein